MIDCIWNIDGPPWKCQHCGWTYPRESDTPPRRNCPKAPKEKPPEASEQKPGVGDILHELLKERIGAKITLDCPCRAIISLMNTWGVGGCRENLDRIVASLIGEARKRKWKFQGRPLLSQAASIGTKLPLGMLFARTWASKLVQEAIEKSERNLSTLGQ
jgi:hypothetical protein